MHKLSIQFTTIANEIIQDHRVQMRKNGIKPNPTYADAVNDIVENKE